MRPRRVRLLRRSTTRTINFTPRSACLRSSARSLRGRDLASRRRRPASRRLGRSPPRSGRPAGVARVEHQHRVGRPVAQPGDHSEGARGDEHEQRGRQREEPPRGSALQTPLPVRVARPPRPGRCRGTPARSRSEEASSAGSMPRSPRACCRRSGSRGCGPSIPTRRPRPPATARGAGPHGGSRSIRRVVPTPTAAPRARPPRRRRRRPGRGRTRRAGGGRTRSSTVDSATGSKSSAVSSRTGARRRAGRASSLRLTSRRKTCCATCRRSSSSARKPSSERRDQGAQASRLPVFLQREHAPVPPRRARSARLQQRERPELVRRVGDQLGQQRRLHVDPDAPRGSQHGRLELLRGHREDVDQPGGQQRGELPVLERAIVEVRRSVRTTVTASAARP